MGSPLGPTLANIFVGFHENGLLSSPNKKVLRVLRKLWNMMVMAIPIVTGMLGMFTKGFEKEHEELEMSGRIMTIQNKA